jgi:hypothetical protein
MRMLDLFVKPIHIFLQHIFSRDTLLLNTVSQERGWETK